MVRTLIAVTINIKHAEENILLQSQQVKYVDSTAAVYMHVNHEMKTMIVVPYELYELFDWGKVPELYGTLQI